MTIARLSAAAVWIVLCITIYPISRIIARPGPSPRPEPHGTGRASIRPGENVGPIHLGDSLADLSKIIPLAKTGRFHYYPSAGGCGRYVDEIDWGVGPRDGLVLIFLTNGRVFQIESQSSLYRARGNLTAGSSPADVKKEFPNVDSYIRVNQHDIASGGRDFVYWVDVKAGIAFAFAWLGQSEGRRVYRIAVFKPGTKFLPEGCVGPPQTWRKLPPYSIEP